MTLTLYTAIKKKTQDTPADDDVPSNQVWLQTDHKHRRSSKNTHILIIQAFAVTLTLKIA